MAKKNKKNFMEDAKSKGYKPNPTIVNGDRILRKIEPITEKNHERQLGRWALFIETKKAQTCTDAFEHVKYDDVRSAYMIEVLKDFIRIQAISIKGTKNLKACIETVRNYWNTFTGAWKRIHDPIPPDTIDTVTQFIYGPLKDELGLLLEKKFRRYPSANHLYCYAIQQWAQDFHVYRYPSTRVNDWALPLSSVFSTARIGEYIESTARAGSGRGLHYRDLMFICLRNSFGQPELAIQLTKDAKNMSNAPNSKRPTHDLSEGDEPHRLCFNALLPYLSRLLKLQAFRDFKTILELFSVQPPENLASCQIHWREDLLDTPFFLSQSKDTQDRIESAGAFSRRSEDVGIRADKYYTEADNAILPQFMEKWRISGQI
ncbi:hypothetical protein MAJ_11226, partial [Metarhizium majus ARSEF 297]